MKKLTFLAALGAGYVLGARAGRERYEAIKRATQRFAGDPRVQRSATAAADFAKEQAPIVKEKVAEAASTVADKVTSSSSSSDPIEDQLPDESLLKQEDPYPKGPLP